MSEEKSKELTREERVTICVSVYGMYMMPMYLSDAQGDESKLCDIDCGMDNSRIPRYRDQLTPQMRVALERAESGEQFGHEVVAEDLPTLQDLVEKIRKSGISPALLDETTDSAQATVTKESVLGAEIDRLKREGKA